MLRRSFREDDEELSTLEQAEDFLMEEDAEELFQAIIRKYLLREVSVLESELLDAVVGGIYNALGAEVEDDAEYNTIKRKVKKDLVSFIKTLGSAPGFE